MRPGICNQTAQRKCRPHRPFVESWMPAQHGGCCVISYRIYQWQKDWSGTVEGMSLQTTVTFNSSCDSACFKFKFLFNTIPSCLQSHPILGGKTKRYDWSVMFSGVVDKYIITCQISSNFCVPKIRKTVHFWMSYSRNNVVGGAFFDHGVDK